MEKLLSSTPSWAGGASKEAGSMGGGEMVMGFATVGTELAKNPCPCCKLTIKQRLYGFASCFGIGVLLSLCSTMTLYSGNYQTFAVLYSFGNLVTLFATGFLIGPVSQCRNMFHKKRIWTTLFYLTVLLATIIISVPAVWPETGAPKTLVVLLLVLTQMLALTWYTLSYIPFARDAVISMAKSCCKG